MLLRAFRGGPSNLSITVLIPRPLPLNYRQNVDGEAQCVLSMMGALSIAEGHQQN